MKHHALRLFVASIKRVPVRCAGSDAMCHCKIGAGALEYIGMEV